MKTVVLEKNRWGTGCLFNGNEFDAVGFLTRQRLRDNHRRVDTNTLKMEYNKLSRNPEIDSVLTKMEYVNDHFTGKIRNERLRRLFRKLGYRMVIR